MEEEKVLAFDTETILSGNKGLAIDHDRVDVEVDKLVASMTIGQLFNEIRGTQAETIDGFYYAGGDEALGLVPYKMVDGPRGARSGNATAFPVALARAATFDVELEKRVGIAIGLETAAKGGNVLLAPTINLLRHPGWGRAQETYSEDTHHTGAMAVAFISGVQNHVLASPKHFAANNVEFTRFDMSANLSPRVLHEVYLPHFKRAVVEAGAASVMSAYNKLNGVYCGENPELLTDILRGDWGFRGFVESDWFLGTRSCAPALNAGLDMEMPAPYRFTDENLFEAIKAGELTEATITLAASRAIRQKLAFNLANLPIPDASIVECEAHLALAREASEKSMVLLKNDGPVLPLKAETSIAVAGDLADWPNIGDRGSSFVVPTETVTPLAGIRARSAQQDIRWFESGDDFSPLKAFDVTILVVGLTYKEEGEYIPTAMAEAAGADLARGGDRATLTLPDHQLELIDKAANHANKLVVVLEGGSAIQTGEWIDKVDALLVAWYPGCQGGHALARLLYGDTNPSGRLPVTIPKRLEQLVPWDIESLNVAHELLPGYKFLDANGEDPEFEFGFGLSYTTFNIDNLFVQRYDNGFEINVDVTNTGIISGATVVQLYVAYPGSKIPRPVRELKGFGRVQLEPGEVKTLVLELTDVELNYYDEANSGWALEQCQYQFEIGFSSRNLPLMQTWSIGNDGFEPV